MGDWRKEGLKVGSWNHYDFSIGNGRLEKKGARNG
jgi:hypothetical protein